MKPKSIKPKAIHFRIIIQGTPGDVIAAIVSDLNHGVETSFSWKTVSQILSCCELAINKRIKARIAK